MLIRLILNILGDFSQQKLNYSELRWCLEYRFIRHKWLLSKTWNKNLTLVTTDNLSEDGSTVPLNNWNDQRKKSFNWKQSRILKKNYVLKIDDKRFCTDTEGFCQRHFQQFLWNWKISKDLVNIAQKKCFCWTLE